MNIRIQKGFTLLEVLLVIAAIGILAAIVLVAINPTRQINQARQAGINSEENAIAKALQQFLIDTGSYPTLIDGVQRKICSNTVATPDCINITTELVPNYIASIPIGTTYTVAKGKDGRAYVNTAETSANLSCPPGYIRVPGNSLYQTKDFCVMKYEAKTGSSTVAATTQAAGAPQAVITQPNAITACSLNGAGYGLISNAEWMTIARNIEAQLSNWTTGTAASTAIGTGALYRGHSDGFTDWGGAYALVAGPDNDGYKETGNSGFSFERRTHTLSNGEIIWDLSGNVSEWTNDTIMGVNKPTGGFEYPSVNNYGNLNYDLISPSNNTWDSDQAMGRYFEGELTGGPFAFIRGGTWGNSAAAGIFALFLYSSPSATADHIGFRCVY